jgi:predicted RNA-binding Zn-ribbon protein involved in translation (DUF1610 family)
MRIENYDIKITIESSEEVCNIEDISNKMIDLYNSINSGITQTPSVNEIEELPIKVRLEEKDRSIIRPRIPNNVVDIKDLTIEKAITENALVRCPSCGQAHCLAVHSDKIYMMRKDYDKNEFGIICEFDSLQSQDFIKACCKEETNRNFYYQDLQKIKFITTSDFAVNNDTEIFCPVCCSSNSFSEWKHAYQEPLSFFETEHLCDACGGEKLEKFIKKSKFYVCDKCGLNEPSEKEDK